MPPVHWDKLFVFTVHPFEIFLRGTFVYLLVFVLMRILRREPGGMGLADLLVIVLIADASQNAMASDYTSVLDGTVLVMTIVFWNYAFDWLSLRSAWIEEFTYPDAVPLIRDGRLIRGNLHSQLITRKQLLSVLREHGVAHISRVRAAYMEGNGRVSVITVDEKYDDSADDATIG